MKLHFENFMSHDETELELPDSGIVLVTGSNGAGKSAIVESMAYCLWGKMLRGDTPWRDDESPGTVEFHVERPPLSVVRQWSGKRQTLSFTFNGETETYETRTKCQQALESIIGPFDLWRRSCVFSSSDAASFSTATDAERKRMLEKLLGLEWFDDALKSARSDYKDAASSLDLALSRMETLEARKSDLKEKLEFYRTQLSETDDADDLSDDESKLKKYKRLRKDARAEVHSSTSRIQQEQRELTRAESRLESLSEKLEAVQDDTCHACGQKVPSELREELQATIERETKQLDARRTSVSEWLEEARDDIESAQSEFDELTKRLEELSTKVRVSKSQLEARSKAERGMKQAKLDLKTLKLSADEIEKSLNTLKGKAAELQVCVDVLGLKGVRAHVLGETLTSIESVANQWLGKLSEGKLQLELRPYSEKGARDAISLKVRGGNFTRASGGERRRVDVSILLALSQIGLSTVGVQADWPLVFDEVFDALDAEGIAQVLVALEELARTRPVLVITHSYVDTLAELADSVLHVADGMVQAL